MGKAQCRTRIGIRGVSIMAAQWHEFATVEDFMADCGCEVEFGETYWTNGRTYVCSKCAMDLSCKESGK
jgi:hypothetical protein